MPQAVALDRMLQKHGVSLDAVIELRVDEAALLRRIENRIAEMKARGEALRDDDNAEALRRRLAAFREQTAPLIAYYQLQGVLRTVDGMAPIPDVTEAIDKVLSVEAAAGQGGKARHRRQKPARRPAARAARVKARRAAKARPRGQARQTQHGRKPASKKGKKSEKSAPARQKNTACPQDRAAKRRGKAATGRR